ncbi:ABC transporter permease [Streptococcus didelphis]|uniref:ABC transporter permease n=1 Tax=Streptococcus didelphis TaxID=102886 RepID=UPI000362334E|nr:ABC transporter permease [Streptococcus didelphis]WMB28910.1 ABC transporter permease [Streptococcus didelphis]
MKKTFWKDILRSIKSSSGRFISLFLLMFIGSFALVGLKVTGPDLERSASHYINKHRVMELSIIASSGFSDTALSELKTELPASQMELGHLLDADIVGKKQSIRILSLTDKISKPTLIKGKLPNQDNEIAIASWFQKNYPIGSLIQLKTKNQGLLKFQAFKVVGYLNSSEIWSKKNLGSSQAGDGNLDVYGFLNKSAFNIQGNIVRLTFRDLKELKPFSKTYSDKLSDKERQIENILVDNGPARKEELKAEAQNKMLGSEDHLLSPKQKEELKHLPKPTYTVYNKSSLPGGEGYEAYQTSSNSISRVGNIFPVLLYLVAALVTFTTMTRFVDEERINSGLFLALGYSRKDIFFKFIMYGFMASFLGTTLGILGGTYFLSSLIAKIVTDPLVIGNISFYFYWTYALLAYALAMISALLPAYLVVRKELFQKPAQLLLPKPPSKGSRIFLEHFSFFWKKLSFTYKITLRNIFRYKRRMFMTIIGVAGSVALLFSGLGIQSSLSKVVDHQFSVLTPYHILLISKDTPNRDQKLSQFFASKEVKQLQKVHFSNLNIVKKGQKHNILVNVIATDKGNLDDFINLKDSKTSKKVTIPKDGIVLSEKFANLYKVKEGQKLTIHDDQNHSLKVTVKKIVQMNVGHYMLMSDTYYSKYFASIDYSLAYFINLQNANSNHISQVSHKLLALSSVEALHQNSQTIQSVESVIASLKNVMALLIILSILLGMVILYNLTSINIAERVRELSTVKVLGFYNTEVTLYIYRETIILSFIGIIVGIIGGRYLHTYIMKIISSDRINFGTQLDSYVYLIPLISITGLLFLLGILVDFRMRKLNMLEALKSLD